MRQNLNLRNVPDNFEERMKSFVLSENQTNEKKPVYPKGFTSVIAYNKGNYQLIPANDLK